MRGLELVAKSLLSLLVGSRVRPKRGIEEALRRGLELRGMRALNRKNPTKASRPSSNDRKRQRERGNLGLVRGELVSNHLENSLLLLLQRILRIGRMDTIMKMIV